MTNPRRFCDLALRVLLLLLPALFLCAGAHAQTFSCPLSSSLAVSGTISPASTPCVIDSGVTLTLDSTATFTGALSGILTNDGTISNAGNFDNVGTTVTNFGTVFNSGNLQGGTVTNAGILDNSGTMQSLQHLNNTATLTNTGTLAVQGPAASFNNLGGANLNNTSSVTLSETGTTNTGTITNFANSQFSNESGAFTNSGSITNHGQFSNTYDLINTPGVGATFNNNGSFTNDSGFLNDGNTPANVFNTVNNNGTFTNSSLLFTDGIFNNNAGATLTNAVGALLAVDQPSVGTIQTLFTNNSGATLINNGIFENAVTMVDSGVITNNASWQNQTLATLTINGVFNNTSGATVQNNSFITIAAGGVLNNSGTYLQGPGNTTVNGVFNTPTSPIQLSNGALFGSGIVNGNVDNAFGFVDPGNLNGNALSGSTLTVNGNYSQGLSGELTIFLTGDAAGQFSVLDVIGQAALDGGVTFESLGGFTPVAGDDFTFLDFGSLSGNFLFAPDFEFWSCPTGDVCSIVTGANSMSLDITAATNGGGGGTTSTPEPSSLGLLAAGFFVVAIGVRMKRFAMRA